MVARKESLPVSSEKTQQIRGQAARRAKPRIQRDFFRGAYSAYCIQCGQIGLFFEHARLRPLFSSALTECSPAD